MTLAEAQAQAMQDAERLGQAVDVYLDTATGLFHVLTNTPLNIRTLRHIGIAFPESRPILVDADGTKHQDFTMPAVFRCDRN